MRAVTLRLQKSEDLLLSFGFGGGLFVYADFRFSARIPHPTPSGPPSPRGRALGVLPHQWPGCFAEAPKKFLFPISFLLNSILWKTLVFSTGMC
jgi:hypothetical protein